MLEVVSAFRSIHNSDLRANSMSRIRLMQEEPPSALTYRTGGHKMLKIRPLLIVLGMLLSPAASADVQVSIGIGLPHVSIGINVPAYPRLPAHRPARALR